MNILISSTIFPNSIEINRGIYIEKQARALSKIENVKVKVIAPVPYFPSMLKSEKYSMYNKIPRVEQINGLEVHHPRYFVLPKVFRSLHGIFFYISLFKFYSNFAKSFSPDIMLVFWAYPDGFANILFSRRLKLPVIIGCLGSDINRFKDFYFHRKFITWSLKRADKVLVVSKALGEEVSKLGVENQKIKTIANGIESDIFCPRDKNEARRSLHLEQGEKIAICVNRLSPEKGVDVLIKAFSRFKDMKRRLLIIGDGAEKFRLKNLAEELGLNGNIQFVGEKPQSEVPDWINASDVLCLPSISEGWPNVLMEALACGTPVVASRVGGVPEIITSDKLGIMVPPGNPDRLADEIERAFDITWDKDFIRDSVAGRTWDTVAQELTIEIISILRN